MDATAAALSAPLFALFNVGGTEVVVILVLVLILFGGDKMPELARGVGKAIREFRKISSGVENELRRAMEEPPPKPKVAPAPIPGATPYSVPPPPAASAPSSTNSDGLPPIPDAAPATDVSQPAQPPVPPAADTPPPPSRPTGADPR